MLEQPKDFRSGFVAIIGAPNVGKSTLINTMIADDFLAVSPVAQTTLHSTPLIHTDDQSQIIFVDTAGILPFQGQYYRRVLAGAMNSALQADLVVRLVDDQPPKDDFFDRVEQLFHKRKIPILRVQTKSDLSSENVENADLSVSALKKEGIEELFAAIRERLPEGGVLFPEDDLSPRAIREFVVDWIRETLFFEARNEVPHATFVEVEEYQENPDGSVRIVAALGVERDTQKGILIGKGGSKIKAIGIAARKKIESRLQCPVHLSLRVKVRKKWRNSDVFGRQFGPDISDAEVDRICNQLGM
jgi:GTP-binding protein Era